MALHHSIIYRVALACLLSAGNNDSPASEEYHYDTTSAKPRIIIETDAGGDPDDEQSLVRFLVYANEWDIEGIIANRPKARDGENVNPVRDGLGIVRRQI